MLNINVKSETVSRLAFHFDSERCTLPLHFHGVSVDMSNVVSLSETMQEEDLITDLDKMKKNEERALLKLKSTSERDVEKWEKAYKAYTVACQKRDDSAKKLELFRRYRGNNTIVRRDILFPMEKCIVVALYGKKLNSSHFESHVPEIVAKAYDVLHTVQKRYYNAGVVWSKERKEDYKKCKECAVAVFNTLTGSKRKSVNNEDLADIMNKLYGGYEEAHKGNETYGVRHDCQSALEAYFYFAFWAYCLAGGSKEDNPEKTVKRTITEVSF